MSWIPSYKKPAGGSSYVPCDWSSGTDDEIVEALEKHYNDEIDLTEYWSVGDTRIIHLDAMQAPNPYSSNTLVAQDITIVIVAMNHTDLATPINGHDKAIITVATRECLHNLTSGYNTSGHIYVNGDSSVDTTFKKWSNLYMRTYLNDTVLNAFPTNFKNAIKQSKHSRRTDYNTTNTELVTDTIFLPSYPEMNNISISSDYSSSTPGEGSLFEYYSTSVNRIKYGNNNGQSNGVQQYWWTGSPSKQYKWNTGYSWIRMYSNAGGASATGDVASALSPTWTM